MGIHNILVILIPSSIYWICMGWISRFLETICASVLGISMTQSVLTKCKFFFMYIIKWKAQYGKDKKYANVIDTNQWWKQLYPAVVYLLFLWNRYILCFSKLRKRGMTGGLLQTNYRGPYNQQCDYSAFSACYFLKLFHRLFVSMVKMDKNVQKIMTLVPN